MGKKYCFGPQVDLDCFIKIVSCFEYSRHDRLLTEICMKNTLIALMKKASFQKNIKIVSNGLILATELYRLNLVDNGIEDNSVESKRKVKQILSELKDKMGW